MKAQSQSAEQSDNKMKSFEIEMIVCKRQRIENMGEMKVEDKVLDICEKHPTLFEPTTFIFGIFLAALGIIIGLELITRVGIVPNTSILGAIIAIAVSKIPTAITSSFRNIHRQNLMQTIISGASFGGANCMFIPMGVLWLLGKPELVPAMMLGSFLGMIIDSAMLYGVFNSHIYPAEGTWPPGIATAECIKAGSKGGKKGILLLAGTITGGIGRYLGYPMDVFGVCWIGNFWALVMLAVGLLFRGYAPRLTGIDINSLYLPHGVMIGAGIVAILQIGFYVFKKESGKISRQGCQISNKQVGQRVGYSFISFIGAAVVMAIFAGLYTEMSPKMFMGFIVFSAIAAITSSLIVGIAAMHAGWFPCIATALIFMVIGMLIGFPKTALAFLVGYTASTGPSFSDMAYDLKTGWILRGRGYFPAFEKYGRRQQYFAELLGFCVAAIVILLFYKNYFSQNLFAPVDRVYVETIESGMASNLAWYLFIWAIPGALLQFIGGGERQLGIILATGLLIYNPIAGITATVALITRWIIIRNYGKQAESTMYILAGGFMVGSALTSFTTATLKLK